MGDDKQGNPKEREITPPNVPTSLETDIMLQSKLKDFDDCSLEIQKRIKATIRACVEDALNNKYERDHYKRKAEESKLKKKLLKDKFRKIECPMYYRSAIEMLESMYIPNREEREKMTRVQRWRYILRLRSRSAGILQRAIRENSNGLNEDNFPECVRDAYMDCNSPIHEYFRDKFGLNPDLKRYFHAHNLHFGQNLTKSAMELLVECLNTSPSPQKESCHSTSKISQSSPRNKFSQDSSEKRDGLRHESDLRSKQSHSSSRRSERSSSSSRRFKRSRSPSQRSEGSRSSSRRSEGSRSSSRRSEGSRSSSRRSEGSRSSSRRSEGSRSSSRRSERSRSSSRRSERSRSSSRRSKRSRSSSRRYSKH